MAGDGRRKRKRDTSPPVDVLVNRAARGIVATGSDGAQFAKSGTGANRLRGPSAGAAPLQNPPMPADALTHGEGVGTPVAAGGGAVGLWRRIVGTLDARCRAG